MKFRTDKTEQISTFQYNDIQSQSNHFNPKKILTNSETSQEPNYQYFHQSPTALQPTNISSRSPHSSTQQKYCSTCGQALSYQSKTNSHYCYYCNKFE